MTLERPAPLPPAIQDWFGMPLTARSSAAAGAVLGALVGDAAGGVLEFMGRQPTQAEARHALLRMPGGGVFGLAPGQFTDDGELTTALLSALHAGESRWDADRVAAAYCSWAASHPFDMGNATSAALGRGHPQASDGLASVVSQRARQANAASKANGALMRISPLAVAGMDWPDPDLAAVARADAALTHPHAVCQQANAAYVLALRHLVAHPGDAQGAFDAADRYLALQEDAGEVHAWLREARAGVLAPAHPLAGFVRHGFTRAFHHLLAGDGFEDAIVAVLAAGGDTDTNACIVGAMLGALHGVEGLPVPALSAVLACDTRRGQARPAAFTIAAVRRHLLPLLPS